MKLTHISRRQTQGSPQLCRLLGAELVALEVGFGQGVREVHHAVGVGAVGKAVGVA